MLRYKFGRRSDKVIWTLFHNVFALFSPRRVHLFARRQLRLLNRQRACDRISTQDSRWTGEQRSSSTFFSWFFFFFFLFACSSAIVYPSLLTLPFIILTPPSHILSTSKDVELKDAVVQWSREHRADPQSLIDDDIEKFYRDIGYG